MKIDDHVNLGLKNMFQKKICPGSNGFQLAGPRFFFFFLCFSKEKNFRGGGVKKFFFKGVKKYILRIRPKVWRWLDEKWSSQKTKTSEKHDILVIKNAKIIGKYDNNFSCAKSIVKMNTESWKLVEIFITA